MAGDEAGAVLGLPDALRGLRAAAVAGDVPRVPTRFVLTAPCVQERRYNPRFVVTNMRQTPRFLNEKVYCARGVTHGSV